jgi:DNA-binding FadR family transcriptional regulator
VKPASAALPAEMTLPRSPKMSEVIARQLVSHIVDEDLPEGSVLPVERALAEQFGVGRSTIREALRLLETRGVLTIRPGPGGGPIVRRPRPADLRDNLTLILQFEGASLADVLDARVALEPAVAALAAQHITDEQIEELAASVDAILDNLDDHRRFLAENQRFHALMADASGGIALKVFLETLQWLADGAVVGIEYTAGRRKAVAQAHGAIVDALRERDPVGAAEAMRQHLGEAGSYWQAKYPELARGFVRWVQ